MKSGWAAAVRLDGPAEAPRLALCRAIELSDPKAPETRQPYHAAFGTLEEDAAVVERRARTVRRVAAESVRDLLGAGRDLPGSIRSAALVVGSEVDPASIANPHIRAHALEGQLFRSVLEDALVSHGISCRIVLEREAYARAAAVLGWAEDEIKRAVTALGRALSGPWRAEQKLAAAAALIALGGRR